jgi:hypothetical protein
MKNLSKDALALVNLFPADKQYQPSVDVVLVQFLAPEAGAWITFDAPTSDQKQEIENAKNILKAKGYAHIRTKVKAS